MIINDQNGNKIDTNKLNDIKALVYEEIANLHESFKKYGLSFLIAVKYDDQNVVGSIFLQQGMDFSNLIEFVDQQVQETTKGDFGIQIVKNEQ